MIFNLGDDAPEFENPPESVKSGNADFGRIFNLGVWTAGVWAAG